MKTCPYAWNRPVTDENMFFGNQEIIDRIVCGYKNGNSNSYVVIGGRRIGKTSLLFQIKRKLLEIKENNSGEPIKVYPVFVDTQALVPLFEQSTVIPQNVIFMRILKILSEDFELINMIKTDNLKEQNYLEEFQSMLENIIVSFSEKDKILLIIDELDVLLKYGWVSTFLVYLRSLYSLPKLSKYIDIILSGSSAINELVKKTGSPFGEMAEFFQLSVLPESEIRKLINESTENQLPKAITFKIKEETGGHPFLIQYIMNTIVLSPMGALVP